MLSGIHSERDYSVELLIQRLRPHSIWFARERTP